MVLHGKSCPVRHRGGWREWFEELSCLIPLPLSYLASSAARCPVNVLISSQPNPVTVVASCISLTLDTKLLSRLHSAFSVLVNLLCMPVPGMTAQWQEHPVAALCMGFEGDGNSGHEAFKDTCAISGRTNSDPFSWRLVPDIEQNQHRDTFEQIIPT